LSVILAFALQNPFEFHQGFPELRSGHIAHEHDAFQGPDVGAGGDHVDGDGDAVLRIGAEGFDGFFCGFFSDFVGDLFAEGVDFIEDFAHSIDDAVAVVVVFGEDEGFGDPLHFVGLPLAFGEAFFEAAVFIGLNDGANLVGGQDAAVELLGEPVFFLVEHFEAFLFGEAVADFDGGAGFDFVALFGELGFDAVDVVAHIDLVDHGVFVGVFGDEVLPKKADGLFGGCGSEANEEGIEVFEHLTPEVVDGAVAFVDDDDIELFDGDVGVVADGPGLFVDGAAFYFKAGVFVGFVIQLLMGELTI